MQSRISRVASIVGIAFGLSACIDDPTKKSTERTNKPAAQFIEEAQKEIEQLQHPAAQAAWVYQTYINQDTAQLSAYLSERLSNRSTQLAVESAQYNQVEVDAETRRKLNLLRNSLVLPSPSDPAKSKALSNIVTELEGMYGSGTYCLTTDNCLTLTQMSKIMANSRNADELLNIWQGWREISPPMKPLYQQQVALANEGAQQLGFNDLSELWRGGYDMSAANFSTELDRLWGQVQPFYQALHCHVRAKLGEEYGEDIVPQNQAIPAHLLGNMWAQSWGNIYDIVKPEEPLDVVDVTAALAKKGYDELQMVEQAEAFFSSLGFDPLPDTFWQRSQFTQPRDRKVVCHASAWNLDDKDDLRIKMCIQKTAEEFSVIHHELGHSYYQRAYNQQPLLYRGSANDGFHEAIGDTISLSITPSYLKQIGLITDIPDPSNDIGMLLQVALEKIAFVPFGLLVDQWRWGVFSGDISPENYNQAWWQLREKYQGVRAPISRAPEAFDPGAKYHVPGNTPYTRYFLAHILQFQFHRELCKIAGNTDPIHRCSIYGSKKAGTALNKMLTLGKSKPWQEALTTLTGTPDMDASAIIDYFAPLKSWLDEQNKQRNCGW